MQTIQTDQAPAAIGTYSQAVVHGNLVFVSGQIPLDPQTGELVDGDFPAQVERVLDNLEGVLKAAGSSLSACLKLQVYLVDLGHFASVNEVMARRLKAPYPARAAVQVSALPKGAEVEIDAIASIA